MSFSFDIKRELTDQMGASRHCQLAELAALISCCGTVSPRVGGRLFLVLQSENRLVISKAAALIRDAFHIQTEVSVIGNGDWKKGRLYTLAVLDSKDAGRILKAVKYLTEGGVLRELDLPVNSVLYQKSCCRRAFVRGAFIGTGSLTDPNKSYHLEIVCAVEEKAEQIRDVIRSFDVDAKIVPRKKNYIVYVQESNAICDMLRIMEANQGMMEMENVRILHEIKGNINRSVNCETANSQKTAQAALEQVRDIEKIMNTCGLDSLPEPLRQMAEVRLANPMAPLKELGDQLDPPVGKSGVNHRLRKLHEIAEDL